MTYKNSKPYCKFCGESNLDNFNIGIKTRCKVCEILGIRLRHALDRALLKGLEFNLDLPFLQELRLKQNNRCIYTGIEFNNNNENYSLSLDRIDSGQGYTKDNIQLTCSVVNYMKRSLSHTEFLNIIALIAKHKINLG